jgi:site-specific recombinase XerD
MLIFLPVVERLILIIKSGGVLTMREEKSLDELIEIIFQAMLKAQFSSGTISNYRRMFKRLRKLAKLREEVRYSAELGRAFIEDDSYVKSDGYCHSRYRYHSRCVQFIESYIKDGQVNWSAQEKLQRQQIKSLEFANAADCFEELMQSKRLKANTKDGYRRLVHYYLMYLEDRGYHSLAQIKSGDTVAFIVFVCAEHYQPTSLSSHLSGLRAFLKMSDMTSCFEVELPERLPRRKEILDIYSDEEYEQIYQYLENSDIKLRDKAICMIALETGLRAVDICNIRIHDIDWRNDCIHIVQEKTGRALNIPLKASYGNAIADYLLSERPFSDSEFVFLQSIAPFSPLTSHSGYRKVLFNVVTGAGVEGNGRSYGTRITRHSTASKMLRQGVPLPVIAEALGHGNHNSVMVYLTTEDAKLAECTLPLPGGDVCV